MREMVWLDKEHKYKQQYGMGQCARRRAVAHSERMIHCRKIILLHASFFTSSLFKGV